MSELRTWLDDHNRYGDDEEISKFKKFKDSLEKALTENVVDPMSKAGYPNAGAAIEELLGLSKTLKNLVTWLKENYRRLMTNYIRKKN
jgi:hypothetical protein